MSMRHPGANALRGGRSAFSSKTLTGNWVEERRAPGMVGSAVHDERWETTTAAMERSATKRRPLEFGAGIAEGDGDESKFDSHNVVAPDKTQRAADWASLTRSAFDDPSDAKGIEFHPVSKVKGGKTMSKEELETYRGRWTREDDKLTEVRFTSEATHSYGAVHGDRYAPRVTRALPGKPLQVERIRDHIVRSSGSAGLRGLTAALREMDASGDGCLSRAELRAGLERMGVKLDDATFDVVWGFMDRDGSGVVERNEFLAALRGDMSERRRDAVARAFASLDGEGSGVVSVSALRRRFRVHSLPEVRARRKRPEEALREFAALWDCVPGGSVDLDEFAAFYADVGAAVLSDTAFVEMVEKAWGL